jgi:hypothetical protein
MAADKLLSNRLYDIAEGERVLFLGHPGVKYDLQQEIAEFFLEIGQIAARDRVGHLVGFFQSVWSDGRKILFQIPGTAGLRRPQRRHDFKESANIAGRGHARVLLEIFAPDPITLVIPKRREATAATDLPIDACQSTLA